jgi:glycosyltransferase involved in cell wall biosynthesis
VDLAVVVPCFNEEQVLPLLVARLRPVLDGTGLDYEVVAVDDGSRDRTAELLLETARSWPQLRVLRLATNSGHQLALTAGLDVVDAEWVVTIDADLQDPPEHIPTLLATARSDGVDVVYARRSERGYDSPFKRVTAAAYYSAVRRGAGVDVPRQVGDYRLMSRRVLLALRALPERQRVYRLLIPWLGFSSAVVDHPRDARAAGTTKYPLRRMVRLAVNSLTSFTTAPLQAATTLGLSAALLAVVLVLYVLGSFVTGNAVPGWASISVVVLVFAAVQLVCLGLLGAYVGRIYEEVQRRPLYRLESDSRDPRVER